MKRIQRLLRERVSRILEMDHFLGYYEPIMPAVWVNLRLLVLQAHDLSSTLVQ